MAGIDMAVRKKPALCVLRGRIIEYLGFIDTNLIPSFLSGLGVRIAAIDSPFSLPSEGVWREVDLIGKRIGLKLLPPGWKGMRRLVVETLKLLEELRRRGIVTIETFPSGIESDCTFYYIDHKQYPNKDLLDSCLAATAALGYVLGEALSLWAEDGEIILPSRCVKLPRAPRFGPSSSLRVRRRLVR
ncbi:hypothetical protein IPA_09400 [Ignicoccus pacificus DSM 13166]|uniref:DUF429 domain-containing protein n=1 Tax=Ignicoccus pacificus DSM 13166 TaxID=940294 RepID=A0A977KC49_9CREN|nr:hypothetical protein IPA_09400 [Ignicoccus pacificus DSM 13166]